MRRQEVRGNEHAGVAVPLFLTAPNTLGAMCLRWCVFCKLWLYTGRWKATSLNQSMPFNLPGHCLLQMMILIYFSFHDTERTCGKMPGVNLTFSWTIQCESELWPHIVWDLSSSQTSQQEGWVRSVHWRGRWWERYGFSQGWTWNPTSIKLRNPQLRRPGPLHPASF